MSILRRSDAGRLNDDVVDDARDDKEVSQEDQGEDGHGGGKRERWELQAESGRAEEGVGEDSEDVKNWVDGGRVRVVHSRGGRGGGLGFRFRGHGV